MQNLAAIFTGIWMSFMSIFGGESSELIWPTAVLPQTELMAWMPYWDLTEGLNSLKAAGNKLRFISPAFYHLSAEGEIVPIANFDHQAIERQASASGIIVLPTVGNDLNTTTVANFLNQPDLYAPAINYLTEQAQKHGYGGYDLDFEAIPLEDTNKYLKFLQSLKGALQTKGLILSVSVHAQTGTATDWNLARAHNYEKIGQIADQVRIMIYDFHNQTTAAGPVTPADKMVQVIEHAKTKIPVEKIVVSLPFYGYDWVDKKGTAVTYSQVQTLIPQLDLKIERDRDTNSMIGKYVALNQTHTIWYEDAQSTLFKIDLAKRLGIYRFCFWRLGGEDLEFWKRDI